MALQKYTLVSIYNVALVLYRQKKFDEAEPFYREALEARRQVLGDTHLKTLETIHNLASLLKFQSKLAEAESLYREALEGYRNALGDAHHITLLIFPTLASLLKDQDKFEEAASFFDLGANAYSQSIESSEPPDTRCARSTNALWRRAVTLYPTATASWQSSRSSFAGCSATWARRRRRAARP